MPSHCFNHSSIYHNWGYWGLLYQHLIHLSNKELIHSSHLIITQKLHVHIIITHWSKTYGNKICCWTVKSTPHTHTHLMIVVPGERCACHPHFEVKTIVSPVSPYILGKISEHKDPVDIPILGPSNHMPFHRELLKDCFPWLDEYRTVFQIIKCD